MTREIPNTFRQVADRIFDLSSLVVDSDSGAFRTQKIGVFCAIAARSEMTHEIITIRTLSHEFTNHESSISRVVRALERDGFIKRECIKNGSKQGTCLSIKPVY